jgi:hypothetical protein
MRYIKNLDSDGKDTRLLIIEDAPETRSIMMEMLQKEYPLMTIEAPKNFFEEDYEAILRKGYDYVLLDCFLGKWGSHHLFGEWGQNIIPYIKEFSPGAKIIATANTADDNAIMTNALAVSKRADWSVLKQLFLDGRYKHESSVAMHPPSSEET